MRRGSVTEWTPTARWRAGRAVRVTTAALPVAVVAGIALTVATGGPLAWLPLLSLVAAPFLIGGLVVMVARHGRRRAALRRLAAEHGWTFARMGYELPVAVGRTGARQFTDRWTRPPFAGRNQGSVADLVTGEFAGREFAELTYSYDRGVRGGATMVAVTVVGLPAALPPLQVSPEGIETSLVPGLRWLDVDLESEAFNRRYRVQAEDRRYAVDVLNPRAVQALLTVEPFTWRIDGSDLVAFGPPTGDPAEILARLGVLCRIADCIPSFVLADRVTGPAVPIRPAGSPDRTPRRAWRSRSRARRR